MADIDGLQELPDACLVVGGRRFGKMVPQIGQEMVDIRPSGGATNHEAGSEELVIRPLAAWGQFLDLVKACRARRAALIVWYLDGSWHHFHGEECMMKHTAVGLRELSGEQNVLGAKACWGRYLGVVRGAKEA